MKFEGKWKIKPNEKVGEFKETVNSILENELEFEIFKQNKRYNSIVGCDSMGEPACTILVDAIKNTNKIMFDDINKFKSNDIYGQPTLYDTEVGLFSPNTLRYILVLAEIEKYIGSLDNKKIIEIGSAHGGQCYVISKHFNFKSYTLIDMPEVIELSKKYISLLKTKNVKYNDINNVVSKKSDLVISNFALSELDDTGINFYFEKIISKTENFYITTNIIDKERRTKTKDKFSEKFNITEYKEPELRKTGTGIWIGIKK